MQNSLFDLDNQLAGFRLEQVQLYNWGTFDGKVYSISPAGRTTLLTGENRSGKSTLADAILTLLVPNRKRNYNLSSGSKKRERNEKSYVKGAWGNVKEAGDMFGKVKYLRGNESYSVLLAVFHNPGLMKDVTIAQIFWLAEDDLKKGFIVSEGRLSIAQDFAKFKDPNELKKKLRANSNTKVYDQFNDYSAHFLRLLGLRSEKALDLFNQTVAIKEIDSLNDFIRQHMLEEPGADEHLESLISNFQNLNLANDAIVEARKQMEVLEPLCKSMDECAHVERRLLTLQAMKDAQPAFFAEKTLELLVSERESNREELGRCQSRLTAVRAEISALEKQIDELKLARHQNEAGRQIELIEAEIAKCTLARDARMKYAAPYNAASRTLSLSADPDEHVFHKRRTQISDDLKSGGQRLETLKSEAFDLEFKLRRLNDEKLDFDNERRSLLSRKSNIPARNLEIRADIARSVGVGEEDLPFVGEILRVKESESEWEGAIERLLHGFGLRLLVDDSIYAEVNRYINGHFLNGKVVYSRVRARALENRDSQLEARSSLSHKLEFKEDSKFSEWLQHEVLQGFDYVCCDSLEQFQRETRALTREGLIKRGANLHEKDDRKALMDRRFFVLGWSNQRKIKALTERIDGLIEDCGTVIETQNRYQTEADALHVKATLLREVLRVSDFNDIDWKSAVLTIQTYEERKRQIIDGDTTLKKLKKSLEDKEDEKNAKKKEDEKIVGDIKTLENEDVTHQKRQEECTALLLAYEGTPFRDSYESITEKLIVLGISLIHGKVERAQRELLKEIDKSLSAESDAKTTAAGAVITQMATFKNRFSEASKDLEARLEYQDSFRSLHDRVKLDDLPRHEERFRKLLSKNVLNDLTAFRSFLEKNEEEIRENIEQLNRSLKLIDYTPSTFVELAHDPSGDAEIRDFKRSLRNCYPDARDAEDTAEYEASFHRIKELIDRLKTEERWRAKVIDVRNWLDFAVFEYYREDNKQAHYYSDSAGSSGGQKAKLAYTILASAISYQYGLSGQNLASQSFRFVLIDEAFSKSDDKNSRYAMELFRRLHLQLMVVTPLDKIDVVDPYIHAIHYVVNNEEFSNSRVYDMSREEYREHRASHAKTESVVAELKKGESPEYLQ